MTRDELKKELYKLLNHKGNIISFYTREPYLRSRGLWDDLQLYSHHGQSSRNQIWEILLDVDPTCVICGSVCKLNSEGNTKQFYKTCSPQCAGIMRKGSPLITSETVKKAAIKKREKTMLKKYGVQYNSQRPEIKPLIIAHCRTDEFKQRMRRLHPPKYLDWQYISGQNETKSVPSIAMELDVSPSLLYNRSKKDDGISLRQHSGISVEESKIVEVFKNVNFDVRRNVDSIIPPYELDVVVPSIKLAIEIDGLYWHGYRKGASMHYHVNKTDMCADAGWQLLHFWDIEINNKFDIVKSMLLSKCGLNNRIYARDLRVEAVDWKQAREFMEHNHIQGHAQFSDSIGLFDGNDLVCCVTYGSSRFKKTNAVEIIRFATKLNTTVIGGFSRLISKLDKPIISYANRRFSNGNVYFKCDFHNYGKSEPCPWYTNDHKHLYHRSKMMKKNLYKMGITLLEEETVKSALLRNGWDWVYDCGHWKFILNPAA